MKRTNMMVAVQRYFTDTLRSWCVCKWCIKVRRRCWQDAHASIRSFSKRKRTKTTKRKELCVHFYTYICIYYTFNVSSQLTEWHIPHRETFIHSYILYRSKRGYPLPSLVLSVLYIAHPGDAYYIGIYNIHIIYERGLFFCHVIRRHAMPPDDFDLSLGLF